MREIGIENLRKTALFLGLIIAAFLLGRYIASGFYLYLLFLLFSGAILLLYHKQLEIFILLMIIINEEFFFLIPRLGTADKDYQYQGFMYIILLITGAWYFFREDKGNEVSFNKMIISLLLIVLAGVINSYFQGQPIIFGLSAARGYFLILFYFIFMAKNIERQKLFKLIIITGVLLSLINNIQYIFFGKLNIFYFFRETERAGQLRFILGGFFITFSSFLALGEYLIAKKKIYLVAFIYMVATVIIQGQTRATIGGIIVATSLLLVLSKKINFSKAVLIGIPLFALSIWILPVIQSTFFSNLYKLTKYEITQQEGGVRIRLDTYDYYLRELMSSPIIGRGIWNVAFRENNPEDMKYKSIYISDIGISSLLFRFGLIGAIWLIMLFSKVYKLAFLNIKRLRENVHYGLIGYFIFIISIMPTINRLTHHRSIIYLALVLALFSQLNNSDQADQGA